MGRGSPHEVPPSWLMVSTPETPEQGWQPDVRLASGPRVFVVRSTRPPGPARTRGLVCSDAAKGSWGLDEISRSAMVGVLQVAPWSSLVHDQIPSGADVGAATAGGTASA